MPNSQDFSDLFYASAGLSRQARVAISDSPSQRVVALGTSCLWCK